MYIKIKFLKWLKQSLHERQYLAHLYVLLKYMHLDEDSDDTKNTEEYNVHLAQGALEKKDDWKWFTEQLPYRHLVFHGF